MASPRQFERRMRKLGLNVEQGASEIAKKAALAIDSTVVLATPVDTGRARSNWQANIGGPKQSTIKPYAPGEGGSTGGANASAAIEQAKGVIATKRPRQPIHITNNLSYIGKLNEGSSAQAPAGFVESAILTGLATIKVLRKRILKGGSFR